MNKNIKTSNYSKEAIEAIKRMVKEKKWKKILIFYLTEANNLPPFFSFLKSLKSEEGKREIINYLIFKKKDPFFEETGLLNSYFFSKLEINKKIEEFLKKREFLLENLEKE